MVRGYRLSIVSWEGSIRARGWMRRGLAAPSSPAIALGAFQIIDRAEKGLGSGSTGTHLSVLLLTMPLRSNLASTLKHQTSAMVSRAAAPLASARVVVSGAGIQTGLSIFIWDASIQTRTGKTFFEPRVFEPSSPRCARYFSLTKKRFETRAKWC